MEEKITQPPTVMGEMEAPGTHMEEMAREINDIRAALNADDTHLNRQPEHVFVNLILPFVAGDTEPTPILTLDMLINMAGGPYKELIITDAFDQELFRVPPVFDPECYTPVLNNGDMTPIKHVVITAQQLHMASPRDSQNFLAGHLSQRKEKMGITTNRLDFAKRWNALAARYGRPPIYPIPGELGQDSGPSSVASEKPHEKINLDDWELA